MVSISIKDTIRALEAISKLKHAIELLKDAEGDLANQLSGMIYILELKYLSKSEVGDVKKE